MGTLAKALGDYGVLSALKAEVDHYYTDLAQTRKIQQDKEGEVKLAVSDALEACRIDCGRADVF